jgi:hypothetical protein
VSPVFLEEDYRGLSVTFNVLLVDVLRLVTGDTVSNVLLYLNSMMKVFFHCGDLKNVNE